MQSRLRHSGNVSKTLGANNPFSWEAYWANQPEVLFFGLYSDISGGQLPNRVSGATDYLTVAGASGAETYQCPNTAPYIAADTDCIWFKTDTTQRTTTTAELIGYDLQRTPVKYEDDAPNEIIAIMILKAGSTITGSKRDKLYRDMWLPILWDNNLNAFGHIKGNRFGQNLWIPEIVFSDIISDGNTAGWYKPNEAGNVTAIAGVESIYWDMMYGKLGILEAEQSAGDIILYAVYKITACEVNFFYTGCVVGDVFVCGTVKTCGANNKVQKYTGNHLTQPVVAKRPVNQILDGSDDFMKTAPFSFVQPEFMYFVGRQITWTINDYIFDGDAASSGRLRQKDFTPDISIYAGTVGFPNNSDFILNTFAILRILFNGANSSMQVNLNIPVVGDPGASNMGGFTLGSLGSGVNSANIEVKEIILRRTADNATTQTIIYDYLKNKYSI